MKEITLSDIWKKLIEVEISLKNHLAHHDTITKWFLAPILVGTVMTFITMICKAVFNL